MELNKTYIVLDNFQRELNRRVEFNLSEKYDTSALKNSFDTELDIKGADIFVNVVMEHYGKWVDEGRKPGKGMPVDLLKKWIQRRHTAAKNPLTVRNSKGQFTKLTESRLNSLSYVINRKIREEGIDPTFFLTEPLDDLFPQFANDIASAYGDDLIDNMLK
jgi:hypothetical protein